MNFIWTCEIQSRIAIAKAAYNNKKALFANRLELNFKKKVVKWNVWSIALCGAETWALRKVDQKYRVSFELLCWRKMEKISLTDRVRNEEVLHRVEGDRNIV